ncbi:MAG: hypothetical protein K0B10_11555 [Vicingaceae bacterium]|nr:hypothetical protein [Vicingaceae bacterium]
MENLYDETIEKLLPEKSFSELSLIEKEKVLKLYTPFEYDEVHNCLKLIKLNKKKEINRLNVSFKNKQELQHYFKEKNKSEQKLFSGFKLNPINFQPYLKGAALTSLAAILFFVVYGKINQFDEYRLTEEEFNKYTTFELEEIEPPYEMDETTEYLLNM